MTTILKPLQHSIIFEFEDAVRNGRFQEKTASGLILGFVREESANAPRFGIVKAIGPDVKEIKEGNRILIEALMWSDGFVVDGVKYWRTSEEKVLAIDEG